MTSLKSIFINQYKIVSLLTISMFLSLSMLIIRIKVTHSFTYIFLAWNLFLALVPYAITTYLIKRSTIHKFSVGIWLVIWLFFLPNAPYIITDFIHISHSEGALIWLDILLITSFAYNGLILYFLSIKDFQKIIRNYLSKIKTNYLINLIFLLTGFGIYLGRFLRYNSWDIISNPFILINDIITLILEPQQHLHVWLFTFSFSCFLAVSYWIFDAFIKKKTV